MKERVKRFFAKDSNYYEPNDVEVSDNKTKSSKDVDKKRRTIIDAFKTRRSIRKFSDRPVEWKCIYEIIDAAINSPCAGNIQNFNVIVIEDKEKIQEIARIQSQQYWIADAPIVLAVVRDKKKLMELYPQRGELYGIQNVSALIENILMLAHFYDYGACWVEACDNEVISELLGVPQGSVVDAIIPIGYPLESPEVMKAPCTEKIFFERYGERKR